LLQECLNKRKKHNERIEMDNQPQNNPNGEQTPQSSIGQAALQQQQHFNPVAPQGIYPTPAEHFNPVAPASGTQPGQPQPTSQAPYVDSLGQPLLQQPTKVGGMFERRLGRGDFLWGILYNFLVMCTPVAVLALIAITIGKTPSGSGINPIAFVLNLISILGTIIAMLALIPAGISMHVRRLHDIGQPGILALLSFVPMVSLFFLIYLLVAPGTEGPNQYGPRIKNSNFWVVLGFKKPTQAAL
jgi:uncharacterized membrane protein YhaH (DUF805 family)